MFTKLTGLIRKGLPTELPLRNLATYVQNPIDIDLETNIAFERDLVNLFKMTRFLSDYDKIALIEVENRFRRLQDRRPCFHHIEGSLYHEYRYEGLQEDGTMKPVNSLTDLINFYKNQELKSPSITR